MTTEGVAAAQDLPTADDGRLFCYRHPSRETYVRCGRCEQPICSACAMQGPVGFRCRTCGTPARDPLTSLTPLQVVLGAGVAVAGGTMIGLIGVNIGFFSLIVAFIGGGFIAEAVRRVIGYKHGTRVLALTLGGILAGALAGYALDLVLFELPALDDLADEIGIGFFLPQVMVWGLIDGVVAGIGAYSRLR